MGKVFDIRTGLQVPNAKAERFEAAKAVLAASGDFPSDWTESSPPPEDPELRLTKGPLIRSAAGAIIAVGLLSEVMAAKGESPSEALSKVLYEDINGRLDTLGLAEQEEAWQLAGEMLDTDV